MLELGDKTAKIRWQKQPKWQCDTEFWGETNAWIGWQNSQNLAAESVTKIISPTYFCTKSDEMTIEKLTWFFRPRDGVFLLHLNFYFESSIASMLIIGIQSQPQIAELIKWWRHVLKTREIIWIIHYYEMTNWWNYFTTVIILTVFQINDFHTFSDWLTLICFDMIGCNGVSRIHKPSFCIQYCM